MKTPVLLLLFIFFALILTTLSYAQIRDTVTIVRVVDGDTLKIRYWGKEESVRLIGIDTPESRVNKKAKKDAKRSGKGYKDYYLYGQKYNKVCRRIS